MRISDWSSDVCSSDLLELAIKVVEESSLRDADDPALPAPPEEDAAFVAPKASSPEAVTPGTTFSDAPVLDDGTVSGSVKEGEQVFYRVPLNWGQTLAAQLDAKALPQAVLDQGGPASLSVDIYSSEERRVGHECVSTCRSRRSPYHDNLKKQQSSLAINSHQ